jgi:hypothetical protein
MRSISLPTRFYWSCPFRFAKFLRLVALLSVILPASKAYSDSVKPVNYGPFFMNQLTFTGSPAGYDYALTDLLYHFQVGWIEPLGTKGLFRETYFETDGNFSLSPFVSDIGTTFNLKPIRYFEMGLSYNRLLYHNSMVAFTLPKTNADSSSATLPAEEWRPSKVLTHDNKEIGGADVFTFQANITFNIGPVQLFGFGSRTLWDVDASGRDYVYEYGNDILIRPRDRVNYALAQISLDLRPHTIFKTVSFKGFSVRNEYWYTTQTKLEKNLISGGITAFRLGQDPERQRRGLDLSLGYWTLHPQIPKNDWVKSLVIISDWKWNIQFLKI